MLFQRLNGRTGGRLINGRNHQYSGRAGMYGGIGGGAGAATGPAFSATLLSTLVPEVFTGSSTPTFTRATTAYVTDFEGLLKQVPSGCTRFTGARFVRNFVPNSESPTGWSVNTVTTATGQTDPLGGTAAFRITATAASNNVLYADVSWPSGAQSGTATWSIWAKRVTGTGNVRLALRGGTVTATLALTTSWQRFSVTGVGGVSGTCQFDIYVDTNGDAIDVWGLLGEEVTGQSNQNPSEYVSKGVLSAPYHGAGVDGVKYFTTQNGNTVASNVVTEATGAAISSATLLGYLAEGARTNLFLQSQTFGAADWGPTNTTVSADQYTAPDGTTTADKLTANAGSSGHYIIQSSLTLTAAAATASYFVKYVNHRWACIRLFDGTNDKFASFDLLNGVVGAVSAGVTSRISSVNGYYRVELTFTTAAGSGFSALYMNNTNIATNETWTAAGTEIVGIWGAQLETSSSFASSYIPTTTVSVTRSADLLTYVTANNFDATIGTAYGEMQFSGLSAAGNTLLSSGVAGNLPLYATTATNMSSWDGTGSVGSAGTGTSYLTGMRKAAIAWGGATRSVSKDGAAAASGAFDGSFDAGASFVVGGRSAGYEPFGNVRNLSIWATKKSDAEIQALTT